MAAASWPLLVGIASLVGVDTYLGPQRPTRPVQVQRSALGGGDFLVGVAALDPRLSGAPAAMAPPQASAQGQAIVSGGESFILDARGSRAAPTQHITEYRWRWLPPAEV